MGYRNICPRCEGFLETLQTFAHCASCLYFEDYWCDSESDFHQAMKVKKEITSYKEEEPSEEEVHDDKECA